jgi:hypothetical protein
VTLNITAATTDLSKLSTGSNRLPDFSRTAQCWVPQQQWTERSDQRLPLGEEVHFRLWWRPHECDIHWGECRIRYVITCSISLRLLDLLCLVSGNLLLHTEEPLFKRFISMSGTPLMLQPLPSPVGDFVYSNVIKSLDAESLSSQGRIQKLLDLSNEALATLVPPSLPLLPIVDGEIIPGNINFAEISSKEGPSVSIPGRRWCEELLIGDCQFDVSLPQQIHLQAMLNNPGRHQSLNLCLALEQQG